MESTALADVVEFPLTQPNIFVSASDEAADGVTPADVECLAMKSTGDDTGFMIIGNIAQAEHYVQTVQCDVAPCNLGGLPKEIAHSL